MPWYRKHGKIMTPLTDKDFIEAMRKGKFTQRKHKGFTALLYYTAVRKTEALRAVKEQFTIRKHDLIFDVEKRLKGGLHTPPLNIPLNTAYADEIMWSVENTEPHKRVWPYTPRTAYNIITRVIPAYPHYFRLSRITTFFLDGWTVAQVRSWTGLSLRALEFYVGITDVQRMGESLNKSE